MLLEIESKNTIIVSIGDQNPCTSFKTTIKCNMTDLRGKGYLSSILLAFYIYMLA